MIALYKYSMVCIFIRDLVMTSGPGKYDSDWKCKACGHWNRARKGACTVCAHAAIYERWTRADYREKAAESRIAVALRGI